MQLTIKAQDGAARILHLKKDDDSLIVTPTDEQLVIRQGSYHLAQNDDSDDICTIGSPLIYPKDLPDALHQQSLDHNTHQNPLLRLIPAKSSCIPTHTKDPEPFIYTITNLKQLMQNQTKFTGFILDLRNAIGSQRLIYAPAIATPQNVSLLTYLGIDLLDNTQCMIAAYHGYLLLPSGAYKTTTLKEPLCACPACKGKTPSELTTDDLLLHNTTTLKNELALIRNQIHSGMLREHIESQVRTDPHLTSILNILTSKYYSFFEERTPVTCEHQHLYTTRESLKRPEIQRFQERIDTRYHKPKSTSILVLLPCSAKKPYSRSKSHRYFQEAILSVPNSTSVHELIITSPLGIVPRELELTYPANVYDIPVTGDWHPEEQTLIREMLIKYLTKNHYDHVILHLPPKTCEFLTASLPDALLTSNERPTGDESLQCLKDTLRELTSGVAHVKPSQRAKDNIESLASYQFGADIARDLLTDCVVKGKHPFHKILTKNNEQRGMLTPKRGLISLTLNGAEILHRHRSYYVQIEDDLLIKGSVFAPAITDADQQIRIGDDVIVINNTGLLACGTALMTPQDMIQNTRGEAVKKRHKV